MVDLWNGRCVLDGDGVFLEQLCVDYGVAVLLGVEGGEGSFGSGC